MAGMQALARQQCAERLLSTGLTVGWMSVGVSMATGQLLLRDDSVPLPVVILGPVPSFQVPLISFNMMPQSISSPDSNLGCVHI